jgi:APA family basic amino acid/polyamine antiporter
MPRQPSRPADAGSCKPEAGSCKLVADFKRALGPFDATMVVIGGIIGAGIFVTPYIVAQRLDTPLLVLAAWAAGGAIALAGAF